MVTKLRYMYRAGTIGAVDAAMAVQVFVEEKWRPLEFIIIITISYARVPSGYSRASKPVFVLGLDYMYLPHTLLSCIKITFMWMKVSRLMRTEWG